ncbi:MAG: hypothetical protein MJZ74_08095 [Muribaculaceae bacterium]|nr:hypothetical protein [Muribaculaceae bacterium]
MKQLIIALVLALGAAGFCATAQTQEGHVCPVSKYTDAEGDAMKMRLISAQQKIHELEDQLKSLRRPVSPGVVSPSTQVVTVNQSKYTDAEGDALAAQLNAANNTIIELRQRIKSLEESAGVQTSGATGKYTDAEGDALVARLAAANRKIADLEAALRNRR